MMTTVETYLRRGRRVLDRWSENPYFYTGIRVLACAGGGFLLSAASLAGAPQPLAMGLICASSGWQALMLTLGSVLGYRVFWGQAGLQGMVWALAGCLTALLLGKRKILRESPLLLPSIAGLLVSAAGLSFQMFLQDDTAVGVYLLRVALGAGAAGLFSVVLRRREAAVDWLALGVGVLALAQVAPWPWLSLGYPAAAVIASAGAFPAAALAGLALDLSGITRVPMTAVLCLSYLPRLIPGKPHSLRWAAPGIACLLVMGLCGIWDAMPLPGLILGGAVGVFLPHRPETAHRRGETGMAQVRLELAAGVLSQTQQLLLEASQPPIDEEALLLAAKERSCGSCALRKSCVAQDALSEDLLHVPLNDVVSLGVPCRRPQRLLSELRRGQDQLRLLRSDRERRGEYRAALIQQYRFLSVYLQNLSDLLPRSAEPLRQRYRPEAAVATAGKETANGDCCDTFQTAGCRFYIVLCDGMGTGLGAAREGQTALGLLRRMLTAGFPPEYALRSINSLLVLRGRGGAVTMDLAELRLDTGKATLYKWGAAPSYLVGKDAITKIGTATPPPGISVTENRETVERLSLRRGETLILLSDGVDGEEVLRRADIAPDTPPGELAALLLEGQTDRTEDDATAAVVRLLPGSLST